MKILNFIVIAIATQTTAYAAEVCVVNVSNEDPGAEIKWTARATCTRQADVSAIADVNAGLALAKVIKVMIGKGYQVQGNDLLVKP